MQFDFGTMFLFIVYKLNAWRSNTANIECHLASWNFNLSTESNSMKTKYHVLGIASNSVGARSHITDSILTIL